MTLHELVRRHGPLPPRRGAQLAVEVLAGLAALHRAGVLHRAVSPGSVLVTPAGAARLVGAGSGFLHLDPRALADPAGSGRSRVLPPELAAGHPPGPAVDVWASGAVLHYAAAGRPPAGDAAAAELPGALLAPALAYGASGEHEDFPGTISLGTEALTGLLVEYGRSAGRWTRRLLVVNGHGGNLDALRAAGSLLRREGRDAAWFPCSVPGADAHAGRSETSLMLHVEPRGVRGDAEPGVTTPLAELLPRLRADGVRAVSPTGVLGDPTGASAEEGAEQLAGLAGRLVAAVGRWDVDAAGRLTG
jgi:creatinine amidohydrolase